MPPKFTRLKKAYQGASGMERIRGSINVPLTKEGHQQAQELAQDVKAKGGLDEVHSSDLTRATDTGDAVAKASGVSNQPDDELHPWRLGAMEGKEVNPDLVQKMNSYVSSPDKTPPPGGSDSTKPPESFNGFKDRVLGKLHQHIQHATAKKKKVGVVGHFRTMRLWESHVKAGGKGRAVDGANMTKPPTLNEEPSHMAQISDPSGKPMFKPLHKGGGQKLSPGVYLMRHGKTSWNK